MTWPAGHQSSTSGERLRIRKLNRGLLIQSLSAGVDYLVENQKEAGNFVYEQNALTGVLVDDDNIVRQAGALWGLALCHRNDPTPRTQAAVRKGLEYFLANRRFTSDGDCYPFHADAKTGRTGSVALVTLALTEFLQTNKHLPDSVIQEYNQILHGLVRFIQSLITANGQFFSSYDFQNGAPFGDPSPYSDGESLLALLKADDLIGGLVHPKPLATIADLLYQSHVTEARRIDPDSDTTKGFFQWGIMSFFELYNQAPTENEKYADMCIELAEWMIDVHQTLRRTRNTAYAHEGLICAWELARQTGKKSAQRKIGQVVDSGLWELTTWQYGGPLENRYIRTNTFVDSAFGGVMNKKNEPQLRIDVTQHQMHAVILALRYIYQDVLF